MAKINHGKKPPICADTAIFLTIVQYLDIAGQALAFTNNSALKPHAYKSTTSLAPMYTVLIFVQPFWHPYILQSKYNLQKFCGPLTVMI